MSKMKFKVGDMAFFNDTTLPDFHGRRVKIIEVDKKDKQLPYVIGFNDKDVFWTSASKLESCRKTEEKEPEWDE